MNYGKTQKGKSALDQRSAALPPRLRPLLVLVDGKKTNDQLEHLAEKFGLGAAAVTELAQLGFIAEGAASDETQPATGLYDDDRTVRVAPNSIDRFLQAKRFMTDALAQADAADSGVAIEIANSGQLSDLTQIYEGFVAVIEARCPADAPGMIAKLRAML